MKLEELRARHRKVKKQHGKFIGEVNNPGDNTQMNRNGLTEVLRADWR